MKRVRLHEKTEPTFLCVDPHDLRGVRKVTGETQYFPGNGFWYVKTREEGWIQLTYADKVEREAIYAVIKRLVTEFENRIRRSWNAIPPK